MDVLPASVPMHHMQIKRPEENNRSPWNWNYRWFKHLPHSHLYSCRYFQMRMETQTSGRAASQCS